MLTLESPHHEFAFARDGINVASFIPNRIRRGEERRIGGSYRQVFNEAIRPFVRCDSNVLELGPGHGTWTRPMLELIPNGTLQTIDSADATEWLRPSRYNSRLSCHTVINGALDCIEDGSIDFCWSMGVLCHNNRQQIRHLLTDLLSKVKRGGYTCLHFADWVKLEQFGWQRGGIPAEFQNLPDHKIWWPRNATENMARVATESGWHVRVRDLDVFQRDGLIVLQRI